MARNKYARDYRLVEVFDHKGKVRVHSEYIGEPFFFAEPAEVIRKSRRMLLLYCLTGWIGIFTAFLNRNQMTSALTVALPLAFAVIPLAMLTELAVSMQFYKEPMEHRHADRMENLLPPEALFTAVFSCISLIMAVGSVVRGAHLSPREVPYFAGTLLLICSAIMVFRLRHRFQACAKNIQNNSEKEDDVL